MRSHVMCCESIQDRFERMSGDWRRSVMTVDIRTPGYRCVLLYLKLRGNEDESPKLWFRSDRHDIHPGILGIGVICIIRAEVQVALAG